MINLSNNFKKYLISFTAGVIITIILFLLFGNKDIVTTTDTKTSTKVQQGKPDTTTQNNFIEAEGTGTIKEQPAVNNKPTVWAKDKDSIIILKDNIANWFYSEPETGFTANIDYNITQNKFSGKFNNPVKTIYQPVYTTTTTEKTITNTEYILPEWQLGLGVSSKYLDNQINYNLVPSLTFNKKILFLYLSVEGKALTRFESGTIKMEPEVNAELKIKL